MKNLFQYLISIAVLGLASCGKPVPLDVKIKSAQSQFVIDGRIDNNPLTLDRIIVRWSMSYLNPGKDVNVSTATVSVKDESGHEYVFIHDSAGIYLPPAEYKGVNLGETYYLSVLYDGKVYNAQSRVIAFSPENGNPIDREFVEKKNKGNSGSDEDTSGYRLISYFRDYPSTNDYYLVEVSRNDSLQTKVFDSYSINIFDDRIFENNYLPVKYVHFYNFKYNDKIQLDVLHLDYQTFKYYEAMSIQANNAGSIFDAPAANIKGNISGDAFGVFLAVSSFSDTLRVRK